MYSLNLTNIDMLKSLKNTGRIMNKKILNGLKGVDCRNNILLMV